MESDVLMRRARERRLRRRHDGTGTHDLDRHCAPQFVIEPDLGRIKAGERTLTVYEIAYALKAKETAHKKTWFVSGAMLNAGPRRGSNGL